MVGNERLQEMMGTMAQERGGSVFATDERLVPQNTSLCSPVHPSAQVLHRQRNHDRSSWTVELPNGPGDALGQDIVYTAVRTSFFQACYG